MKEGVIFPIVIEHSDGRRQVFRSMEEIEEEIEYFLIDEEPCKVYDAAGKLLILNVFLSEIKDLHPK